MAGLLDMVNDPRQAFITQLGMGLLSAGGPSTKPVSFGQAFGAAMAPALQGAQQAQEYQTALAEKQRKRSLEDVQKQQIESFISSLPTEQQAIARANPEKAIEAFYKAQEEYTLGPGNIRYRGGRPVASAPFKPDEFKPPEGMVTGEGGRLEWIPGYLEGRAQIAASGAPVSLGQPVSAIDPKTGLPMLVQFGRGGEVKAAPFEPYNAEAVGQARKQKAGSEKALTLIDEAEKWVDKATGSYVGATVDAFGRLVGASSDSAQAAARLGAIQGALMMAQPRMEGPQSNLDVALYERMAGKVGDPTVPAIEKRAALDTIRDLHQKYAGGDQGKKEMKPKGAVTGKFLGFE